MDVRVLAWAFQLAVLAAVVALGWWLWNNFQVNSDRLRVSSSLGFLDQPAGYPVPGNPAFRQTQPVREALIEGTLNTLRLVVTGVVLATVLGTLLGIARLSRNFLVRKAAQVYVEFVRNVPLLVVIILMYSAVALAAFPPLTERVELPDGSSEVREASWILGPLAVLNVRGVSVFWFDGDNWRAVVAIAAAVVAAVVSTRWRTAVSARTGRPSNSGLYALGTATAVGVLVWIALGLGATSPQLDGRRVTGGITMTPEYFAALAALVIYTSSHIAEIVRGSIQAVPKGQSEAANAVALSGFQRMWYVIMPQSMRIAVPPIGNQYLNLAKNSSLAAAISFPEVTKLTTLGTGGRHPAVPSFAVLLLIYLAISLALSAVVNVANRRLAIVER